MEEQDVKLDGNGKAGALKLTVKIALVALIVGVIFYFVYFGAQYGKAALVLSNVEISSTLESQVTNYGVGDRVYFFIKRNYENLDSNMFALEIEYFENNSFKRYKQISFEIEKDFEGLGAYVPGVYFKRPGKYRIRASLDGRPVAASEIEVSER